MILRRDRECKKIPKFRSSLLRGFTSFVTLALSNHLSVTTIGAQMSPPLERALTQDQRASLYTKISNQIAHISRTPLFKDGVHPVGVQTIKGRGFILAPQLILTAEAWLERGPLERSVSLSAHLSPVADRRGAKQQIKLSVLYRSAKTGFAVLSYGEGHTQRRVLLSNVLSRLKALKRPQSLSAPRTLWTASQHTSMATPVMLTGRAQGYDAYYWRLNAPMLWGDPLFSDTGEWLSLSCSRGRLLPLSALTELIEELSSLLSDQ